jgi:hypothetical protein
MTIPAELAHDLGREYVNELFTQVHVITLTRKRFISSGEARQGPRDVGPGPAPALSSWVASNV